MTPKALLKQRLPMVYDRALKLGTSKTVRSLRALPHWVHDEALIARNAPLFAVDIRGRTGLGASLSKCVEILHYCSEAGLQPRLRMTNENYAPEDGADVLDAYFLKTGMLAEGAPRLSPARYVPLSSNQKGRLKRHLGSLTLLRANELFSQCLSVRPEISEAADTFCKQNRIGPQTIGVHFRGTDKYLEATRPDWVKMSDEVGRSLQTGAENVFVATDEPEFLEYMRSTFATSLIVDLDCKETFSGGRPAHLTQGDPVAKAHEAIKTILVLSRCGLLIRGPSHLSAWAKILNPSIRLIVHGEPHRGDQSVFPESLLATTPVSEEGL